MAERLEQVLIGLRPWHIRRINEIKRATNLSRSAIVREAVDEWLKGRGPAAFRRESS